MKRAFSLTIPETLAEAAHPDATAPIVYDMQVGILRQLGETPPVLASVLKLLEIARGAQLRIFFMRHMSLPKRLSGVFQLRKMMAWQRKKQIEDVRPWFLRDSPGFMLAPELKVRDDEAIFDKITSPPSRARRSPLRYAIAG